MRRRAGLFSTMAQMLRFTFLAPAALVLATLGIGLMLVLGAVTVPEADAHARYARSEPGADVIVGLGGKDKIDGKGGKDVICGGTGNDTLTGGSAVDKFDGGTGNDTLFARDGLKETTVKGGSGTDRVRKDKSDKTTSVEKVF